ncbi:MAG: endonuclease/exonuclease/phosphatase family protein [Tannerellaceae bacterium]
MKKFLFCLVAALMFVQVLFAQDKSAQMNVMSYNIRMDNPNDGENQWKFRKDLAANVILFYNVDVFGAQEVLHNQLTDLLERLPAYDYVGVGREDGKTKGEYSPIFYKKDCFSVMSSGTFWLSEDMNAVGKKGWDAACERVATWAILREKASNKEFFILNTHLDHMGTVARHEGALLVLDQTQKLGGNHPVIVMGDFNATPDDDPIRVLTNPNDPRSLTHSRTVSPLRYGPEWTFHDFGRIPAEKRSWIDYIFVKGDIRVLRHGVLTETLNQLYPSDHCPVISTLELY